MSHEFVGSEHYWALVSVTNIILNGREKIYCGPPNPLTAGGTPYVTIAFNGPKAKGEKHFEFVIEGDEPTADEWVRAGGMFRDAVKDFLKDAKKVCVRKWPEFDIILVDGIGPRILTGRTRLAIEG